MLTEEIYNIWKRSTGVSTDTRTGLEGKLFFALSGENFDGNRFAEKAIEAGAIAAVIDKEDLNKNENFLLVDDSLQALQDLARYHREKLKTTVLAITGSNGKTTSKELISAVLSSEKTITSTKGNLNNHIGVPLSLLQIKKDTEIAIIEMGANHAGEIKTLCDIASPDFGIITNIGKAHLEGFGSLEGVVEAKNELYNSIRSVDGGLILNADDELLVKLADKIKAFTYGTKNSDITGKILSHKPTLHIEWRYKDRIYLINSQLYGQYNFTNIMASIACGIFFGISTKSICNAIENYKPENKRSQILKTKENTIILDAYNANPVSMLNAINSFKLLDADKPLLILGDMFELGSEAEKEHKNIIDLLRKAKFDDVYLVGSEFYKFSGNKMFDFFESTSELKSYLTNNKIKDKTILIKGSRAMKLEDLLETL
jgi:UDP-N-acetylmuramoyl-tripeptide--D-alanyl-D-alanine ligase